VQDDAETGGDEMHMLCYVLVDPGADVESAVERDAQEAHDHSWGWDGDVDYAGDC